MLRKVKKIFYGMGKGLGNILPKIISGVLIRLYKSINCDGHENVLLKSFATGNITD